MTKIIFLVAFAIVFIGSCTAPSSPKRSKSRLGRSPSFTYNDENELASINPLIRMFPFTPVIENYFTPCLQNNIHSQWINGLRFAFHNMDTIQEDIRLFFKKVVAFEDSFYMKLLPGLSEDVIQKVKQFVDKKLDDDVPAGKFRTLALKIIDELLNHSEEISYQLAKYFEKLIVQNEDVVKEIVIALVSPSMDDIFKLEKLKINFDFDTSVPVEMYNSPPVVEPKLTKSKSKGSRRET